MALVDVTYGFNMWFQIKMGDFYIIRAFLQGKKWDPFHSSDVKTKPYMLCDDPLKFTCTSQVSECKQIPEQFM